MNPHILGWTQNSTNLSDHCKGTGKGRKMPRNVPARPIISQNAMILPIALSSFLEGPSFGFLQEHNGEASGLSLHREALQPLGSHGMEECAADATVCWCSPFLLPTDARELTPKPKAEQAMPLLICLYSVNMCSWEDGLIDGWMDKY